MPSGRQQLAAWRDRSKLKQYEIARLVRITEAYLSQVLSGKRRPSLPIALRIQSVTGVPVESWVDMRVGRADPKRKRVADNPEVDTEISRA